MKLSFDEIKSITVGAVKVSESETGFHFAKMTDAQLAAFKALSATLFTNASTTTGVRLDFVTTSHYVSYMTLTDGKYEVKIDGLLSPIQTAEAKKEITLELPDDGRPHRVTLHLPSHGKGGLAFLALEDGATFTPHRFDRKFLFLGDSITQGWNAELDTLSYAYLVSDHFNAESIIQGTGGAYYDADTLDRTDFEPDTVFVAYGTNDANKFKTLVEIAARAAAYLKKAVSLYPSAKICVITPVWRVTYDTPMPYGHVKQVAAAIEAVAADLGLSVIRGIDLIPHCELFMADNLHPNALGFCQYAHNLIRALQ